MDPIRNYERQYYSWGRFLLCSPCYDSLDAPWNLNYELHVSRSTSLLVSLGKTIICTKCGAGISFVEKDVVWRKRGGGLTCLKIRSKVSERIRVDRAFEDFPVKTAVRDYNDSLYQKAYRLLEARKRESIVPLSAGPSGPPGGGATGRALDLSGRIKLKEVLDQAPPKVPPLRLCLTSAEKEERHAGLPFRY